MYLDDGVGGHRKCDTDLQLSTHVCTIMEFGFLLAHENYHWEPVKVRVWLGYVTDMIQGKLFVTEERIAQAFKALASMLGRLSKTSLSK